MIKILKYQKMNKKGIFFTILAIALLSLFLISYSVYSFVQNREGINKRIKTMNSYVSSLEKDIPRKLYISGYRIIFVMEEKIVEDGKYMKNISGNFSEAFFTGNLSGKDYVAGGGMLNGVTFPFIVSDINKKANSLNIDVTFINPKVSITQTDPWHVKVILDSNLMIKDKGNLASWNRTSAFYAYIPIENFEDPIYTLNTNAKVVNKFVKTTFPIPISSNITSHAENSYYTNYTYAPSFLQRLQGDLTADPNGNGIESLVNTHKLSQQGFEPPEKCIIDYIYFSSNSPATYIPSGAESWIKIENTPGHIAIYGPA